MEKIENFLLTGCGPLCHKRATLMPQKTTKAKASDKLTELLRVRCEDELKKKIEQLAKSQRMKPAAAIRNALWDYVNAAAS